MQTLLSTYILFKWGEQDFGDFKVSGEFYCGYTEFVSVTEYNKVAVYYPIDKETYDKNIKKSNCRWARDGEKSLAGPKGGPELPKFMSFIFNSWKYPYMNVCENAPITQKL